MKTIEIRKYRQRTNQQNALLNYFDTPELVDVLKVEEILSSGFPNYNESYELKFETFNLSADDIDVMISFLQENISGNNGRRTSVKDFFENQITDMVLVVKINIDGVIKGGIIETGSIILDYTKTKNRWDVSFTIYGIEKEFTSFMANKQRSPLRLAPDTNNYFNSYIQNNHFSIPNYIEIDTSRLNWNEVVGYEPVLIREMWNAVISLDRDGDATQWSTFTDLCVSWGLVTRFVIEDDYENDYFKIRMYIFFRNRGSNVIRNLNIDKITHKMGYYIDMSQNEFQIIKIADAEFVGGTQTTDIWGIGFNSWNTTNCDGQWTGQDERRFIFHDYGFISFFWDNTFPLLFPYDDNTNVIEMNNYFSLTYVAGSSNVSWFILDNTSLNRSLIQTGQIQKKRYSFPRMWTRQGYVHEEVVGTIFGQIYRLQFIYFFNNAGLIHNLWAQLMYNLAVSSYRFLAFSSGVKKLYTELSLINNSVNLFDTTTVDGVDFMCIDISDMDLLNKTVSTEWIELNNN